MAKFNIFKETALPSQLLGNSVYLITSGDNHVEMYVTGTDASNVRRVINESDINAMISTAINGISAFEIVADVAARDALTFTANTMVLVNDASADPTVNSGAALYAYNHSSETFTKVSEYESLDLTIDYANIQNKPTSTVADIDDSVSKRHAHTNKTQLDKISEDVNGDLTYGGSAVSTAWGSVEW